jgi:ribosomal protein S18 acetylase RimI-like enzyme
VLPQAKQRGVATEMLRAVERQVQARGVDWVFSFVVVTPVTNFASMMFHEKNGFERAAILGPDEYVTENGFRLDVFQSFLYGKRVS